MTVSTYELNPASSTCTKCKCPVCGEVFSGERPFDAHRFGKWSDRQCQKPSLEGHQWTFQRGNYTHRYTLKGTVKGSYFGDWEQVKND